MKELPRLILIPGWAHDASAMEDLRKHLEDTANVSSISTGDLWSANKEASFQSPYAQNLVKLIKKTGDRVFIAGWSLGGMIALETAAHQPDLVAGLVLISSTAKFRADKSWTAGVTTGALRAMKSMFKSDPRGVLRQFFKNVAFRLEGKNETLALKIEKACAMNPLELSAGLEYLSVTDLRNEATKVNIPVLILHGKQDIIIPVEAGIALKNMLPISKIRVYDNYGHGLSCQNPRAIAEDIKEFLKECRN